MTTPAIIVLVCLAIRLLVQANMHGKKIEYAANFCHALTSATISLGLLYWGGFFN